MKRAGALVLVLVLGLVFCGVAFSDDMNAPDATLKLTEGQVALGIGWSWGKGVLTYKGKDYPFKVDGLSVGSLGATEVKARGKVYNLKKLSDFNGNYVAAAAEGTVGVGAGVSKMENQNGVVVTLSSDTEGANLKIAAEGVDFTLEKGM